MSKTYIRKPSGQLIRLDARKHPHLNQFLLSFQEEIITDLKIHRNHFIPKEVTPDKETIKHICREISLPYTDWFKRTVEITLDDVNFVVLKLKA